MRSRLLIVVLAIAACPSPRRPDTTVPDRTPPKLEPRRPTETATVQLSCVATLAGYHDYPIDVVYDRVNTCRMDQRVSLILESSTQPGARLTLELDPYGGPGRHVPNVFSVVGADPGGSRPAEDCSDGTVEVVDGGAGGAFPRPIGFVIHCPSLRNVDTHTCGSLDLNLQIDCPG